MFRSPRRRLWILLAVPLLLLAVLGAVKWCQDHPPLSPTDRMMRKATRTATHLQIIGWGPDWQPLTGAYENQYLYIEDRRACLAVVETLRCTDQWIPVTDTFLDLGITVSFADTGQERHQPLLLTYRRGKTEPTWTLRMVPTAS